MGGNPETGDLRQFGDGFGMEEAVEQGYTGIFRVEEALEMMANLLPKATIESGDIKDQFKELKL